MHRFLIAAAAGTLMSGAAFAADLPAKAPPIAPAPIAAYNWSGFYFGGSLGWERTDLDVVNPGFPASAIHPHNSDGLFGGHVGVQRQFGMFVLGLEGSWQGTFNNNDHGDSVACFGPNAGLAPGTPATCRAWLRNVWTVGPRAGLAFGNWMPYVTGGYARGAFTYRAYNPAGVAFEQADTDLNGSFIGGGLDWMLSPSWVLGLEYRHYQFSNRTANAVGLGTTGFGLGVFVEPARFHASSDTVSARLSWMFGWR